jgi:adenine phosphoribosyltransferase
MPTEQAVPEPQIDPELERLFRESLRDIPDFPIPGIVFKDIAPVLARPRALSRCAQALAYATRGFEPDTLLAVDARGFLIGGALADRTDCGLVMVRKPGKLPGAVVSFDYANEYGSGRLEITRGVIAPGSRCLFVDDLLATGGTARATADCVKALGASIVGYAFLLEICFLNGRFHLQDAPVVSLVPCR